MDLVVTLKELIWHNERILWLLLLWLWLDWHLDWLGDDDSWLLWWIVGVRLIKSDVVAVGLHLHLLRFFTKHFFANLAYAAREEDEHTEGHSGMSASGMSRVMVMTVMAVMAVMIVMTVMTVMSVMVVMGVVAMVTVFALAVMTMWMVTLTFFHTVLPTMFPVLSVAMMLSMSSSSMSTSTMLSMLSVSSLCWLELIFWIFLNIILRVPPSFKSLPVSGLNSIGGLTDLRLIWLSTWAPYGLGVDALFGEFSGEFVLNAGLREDYGHQDR